MSTQIRGNPLQALITGQSFPGQMSSAGTLFPQSSRYFGLQVLSLSGGDGPATAYLERRFIPLPDTFEDLYQHTVQQGDRLDNIAYRYLNDAEQAWRICDANGALDPDELTATTGRTLRITLPQGFPGIRRA